MAKATVRNVDFSQVKDGGGNFNKNRIPAGDYLAIISKVEDAVAKDKTDQYLFSIKIKNRPSSVLPYYCKLQENQLWKLRNLFVAAGKTVPKKRVKVDPNQIVGKLIGVAIEDTEYEGKEQSQVAAVFPAAELGDDSGLTDDNSPMVDDDEDDDDEDVAPGPRFTPSDDDDDEEEEADDEEDEAEDEAEDLSALTRAELKDRIRALQPDFVVRKSMTDADLVDTLTNLTSDAGSDDEEEEEEPEPQPKKTKSSTAAKRKAAKAKVDEDDLDGLNIDDL